MATWRDIAASEVDADSPGTATLFSALANNPSALAEGASGAPKVANKTVGGSASAGGTLQFSSLDDFAGIFLLGVHSSDGASSVTIAVSDDNGSSWSATTSLQSFSTNDTFSFFAFIDFDSGDFKIAAANGASYNSGTVIGASLSITDIRFSTSTGEGISILAVPQGGESAS